MALVTGIRDDYNTASAKLKIDMSEKIALLQPSATPLITFLKRAKNNTEVANNPKYSWLEDDLGGRWDAINNGAGYADSATDMVVDNIDLFAVNQIVKVPRTGECLRVTVVTTGTSTITVTRAFGTTSAAALVDNDPLVILGNVNEEGATAPTVKSTQETEVYNYTRFGCAA